MSWTVRRQIIGLAHGLGAALVVLGLHRERRVLDTLRMTTMERITLGVDCPVLVAQTDRHGPTGGFWAR